VDDWAGAPTFVLRRNLVGNYYVCMETLASLGENPLPRNIPLLSIDPDWFWKQVSKSDQCWIWTRATNKYGYGKIHRRGLGMIPAHRFAWETAIEDGV
jgi:hypothetical protein